MGIHITDGRTLVMDAVDLSALLVDATMTETAPLIDRTTQASGNTAMKRGKKGYKGTLIIQQDYATGSTHDTIQAAAAAGFSAMVIESQSTGGISYTGDFTFGDYVAVPAGKGDNIAEVTLEIESAGDIVLGATI